MLRASRLDVDKAQPRVEQEGLGELEARGTTEVSRNRLADAIASDKSSRQHRIFCSGDLICLHIGSLFTLVMWFQAQMRH